MSALDPSEPVDSPGVIHAFWEAASEVTEAVGEVLGATTEWGASGEREGQYRVDLVVDRICGELLGARGFAVLSEESGLSEPLGGSGSRAVVVLDPLDGSTNASRHLGWCATAMCLVDASRVDPRSGLGSRPVAAWVAHHGTGDRYRARVGHGADRNGEPMTVRAHADLAEAIVGVSGLPSHHYGWAQFRAFGAAALDICAVASGSLDAWCDMSRDAHGVWDYLAAMVVCLEAGGVVAEVAGRDLVVLDPAARRTPIVASGPGLLAELLAERGRSGR